MTSTQADRDGFGVVTTTVADLEQAQQLARAIVDKRLAACVQITPVTSIYRWKGRVEQSGEHLLAAKTTMAIAPELMRYIGHQHTYDVPEVIVTPIEAGSPGYLDWIAEEVENQQGGVTE